MIARSLEHGIALVEKAFEEADIDALIGLHDEHGTLLSIAAVNGQEVQERDQLRQFYANVLAPGRFVVRQLRAHLVEASGISLLTTQWTLGSPNPPFQMLIATVVFRKQPDGDWKGLTNRRPVFVDQFGEEMHPRR